MKNAKTYEAKIRKLLKAMPKTPIKAPQDHDTVAIMVEAIMSANTTPACTARAMSALEKEFLDFNELRVAPKKDIYELLEHDYPDARERATQLTTVLANVYIAACEVSLNYLQDKAKRELRRLLQELGMDEYASAYVMAFAFDMHAIPVDRDLVDSLEMNSLAHPGSSAVDVQKILERAVNKTKTLVAHKFLRSYVQKSSKALTKKRKAEALARAKIEAREEAERLAAEKEAAAKKAAKAAKEAKAAKAAEAAEAAKAKKAKEAKKAKKKTAKKAATKKTVKKATKKKVAEKKVKKAAKPAQKTAPRKKAKKKTAKK